MADWADEIADGINGNWFGDLTVKELGSIAEALRKARADALEEAARAAEDDKDDCSCLPCTAQRIRALKDKP